MIAVGFLFSGLLIGKFHFLVADKTRAVDRSKGVITSRDGTGIHIPGNIEKNFVTTETFPRSVTISN